MCALLSACGTGGTSTSPTTRFTPRAVPCPQSAAGCAVGFGYPGTTILMPLPTVMPCVADPKLPGC